MDPTIWAIPVEVIMRNICVKIVPAQEMMFKDILLSLTLAVILFDRAEAFGQLW